MKRKNKLIGQSILEYTVVIIVVVAALMAMFGLLNRHIQGSWREAADTFGQGRQFADGVLDAVDDGQTDVDQNF